MPSSEGQNSPRAYKLVSAIYKDTSYPDAMLFVYEERSDLELRHPEGKRSPGELVIARFHVEPNAEVKVEGAAMKISDLSITLESAANALEVEDLLKRPARVQNALKALATAEWSVGEFLEARDDVIGILLRLKTEPRKALLSVESLWTTDDATPVEAVQLALSKRVAESLDKMTAALAPMDVALGPRVVERLYAVAYAVGTVQNDLLSDDSVLAKDVVSLKELGVETTLGDLHMEGVGRRLLQLAHPGLEALTTASALAS